MEKMSAIVVAAGSGERYGGKDNKIFAKINDQPLFLLALQLFVNREDVCQTILVVSPADADQMKSKYGANLGFMGVKFVTGGAERHDSVAKGLQAVDQQAGYVAIHDAARVCVAADWIDQTFAAAVKHGAAVPVCPVTSTLKRVREGLLTETVDRSGLFLSQTPQIFRRDIITSAYEYLAKGELSLPDGAPVTDDAQIAAAAGHDVHAVDGDARNIKITTKGDLTVASALIRCLPQKAVAKRGVFEEAQW